MRKLSILALVVILAGAMSVVAVGGQDSASKEVTFGTASQITLNVNSANTVDFGYGLDPNSAHIKTRATELQVESNTDWTIESSKGSSTAASKLSVGFVPENYSNTGDSFLRDNFGNYHDDTYSGSGDKSGISVSYKLDDLADLDESKEYSVDVTFTATTQ